MRESRLLDLGSVINAAVCDAEGRRLPERARALEATLRRDPHAPPEPPLSRADALDAAKALFASLYPDRSAAPPMPPA